MSQQERTQSSVKKVLQRLETYIIYPERRKIEQRAKTIFSLIPKVTTQHFIDLLDRLKTSDTEKEREEFENIGVSYLLQRLKEEAEKSGQVFEIRIEQIEAIVALLQKNHIQAATGFGKSSVIIPIASVIGALSENGQYAVVSVSPELKAELFEKIKQINDLLPPHIRLPILSYHKTEGLLFEDKSQEKTFRQLTKAIVENPSQQEVINQQQRTLYFEQLLTNPAPSFHSESQQSLPSPPKDTPSITLFNENDYVFYTIIHPDSQFTHTIFDEIHVPRSRNSIYYHSSLEPFLSPQAVETYLFKRFLAEYFKRVIDTYSLPLKNEKGRYWFQDEAVENSFFEKAVFNDPKNQEIFEQVVDFMAKKTELDKEKLKEWLKRFSFKNKNYEDVVSEVLLSLLRAKAIKEGVHYQQSDGQQIVRDRFMGIALPSHRFSFDIQLGLQAWDGSVSFADYFENAAETVSFEGWIVHYLGGRISGLSGTLFTPTLTNPYHPKKTSLARFLEKYTQGQSIFIGQEKYALPPEPQIFENNQVIEQDLFQQLQQDRRQTIIFCYDENEAKKLQDILYKNFPKRQIILANASITEEEAKKRYHEFADNKNAILISTGRTGVGIDIKDSQGDHTDHKSIIYGLPWSIDQIYQALGRRRMESQNPKNDFVWLVSLDQIKNYDGYLALKKEEQERVIQDLNNPSKKMWAIEKLIKNCEEGSRISDSFLIDFDRLYKISLARYQERVEQRAKMVLANILTNLQLTPRERTLVELFFEQIFNQSLFSYFANFIKAPSSLYWHLRNAFSYIINPSSLGAEVERVLNSIASEENVQDWLEAKTADFEYFLSQIILPQIRQIPNYNLLLKSKHPESIRFMVGGFMPVEPSELNLEKADLEELKNKINTLPPGLNKITLPSSQTLYLYVNGKRIFFLVNNSKQLITTTGKEILSTVFSSQKGPQILVIFQ